MILCIYMFVICGVRISCAYYICVCVCYNSSLRQRVDFFLVELIIFDVKNAPLFHKNRFFLGFVSSRQIIINEKNIIRLNQDTITSGCMDICCMNIVLILNVLCFDRNYNKYRLSIKTGKAIKKKSILWFMRWKGIRKGRKSKPHIKHFGLNFKLNCQRVAHLTKSLRLGGEWKKKTIIRLNLTYKHLHTHTSIVRFVVWKKLQVVFQGLMYVFVYKSDCKVKIRCIVYKLHHHLFSNKSYHITSHQ